MSFERWSVWLANLEPVVGSEQGKTRPVLIISQNKSNQILPVVNILPITSRKPNRRIYPNEALLEANTANLLMNQLFCVFKFGLWINGD
ncbi:MAG: type II toxin-antitoxin system PemK/MazF family toxin [Pyrinomonadaceae bacterium]